MMLLRSEVSRESKDGKFSTCPRMAIWQIAPGNRRIFLSTKITKEREIQSLFETLRNPKGFAFFCDFR